MGSRSVVEKLTRYFDFLLLGWKVKTVLIAKSNADLLSLKTFARFRESKLLRRWATAILLAWSITCFLSLTPVALPLNHIPLDTIVPPGHHHGHHHHHRPSKQPHKLTLKTIVPANNDGHRSANQLLNNQAPNITKPVISPILRNSSTSSWVASLSSIYAGKPLHQSATCFLFLSFLILLLELSSSP